MPTAAKHSTITKETAYPFGMLERSYSDSIYKFGFNTQEKVPELGKNHYTALFWEYDSRLARRWNLDPKPQVFISDYISLRDNPISFNDPNGDCPVCIILFGLLTVPSIAVAPTGNYEEDSQAIEDSRKLQTQWIVFSIIGGGLSSGAISTSSMAKQMAGQFTTQILGNAITQRYVNGKIDFKEVLNQSFKNIDFADAFISQINTSNLIKNILSASIDITPEEAQLLGLNKGVKEAGIEFIINTISTKFQGKFPRGKYSSIIEKVAGVVENKTNDFLNNMLDTQNLNNYLGLGKDDLTIKKDATEVTLPPVKVITTKKQKIKEKEEK